MESTKREVEDMGNQGYMSLYAWVDFTQNVEPLLRVLEENGCSYCGFPLQSDEGIFCSIFIPNDEMAMEGALQGIFGLGGLVKPVHPRNAQVLFRRMAVGGRK